MRRVRFAIPSALRRMRVAQEGTALVEFAIVLPMLALLVVGLIEVGRFTALSIRLSNAAHAGATYGISRGSDGVTAYQPDSIESAACSDSGFSCSSSTPAPGHTASPDTMYVSSSVSCTYSNGNTNVACPAPPKNITRNMFVQVSTSGTFQPLLHYPYMPNSVPMSATATMQVGL